MQRPDTETILIAWPSLPRTTVGRILQRQRATLRRLRDSGLGRSGGPLEKSLEHLLAQWVDAATAGDDVVSLQLGVSPDDVDDWLASSRELLLTMADENVMASLGGPALSPSDASVLRGMIDHVARVTSAD